MGRKNVEMCLDNNVELCQDNLADLCQGSNVTLCQGRCAVPSQDNSVPRYLSRSASMCQANNAQMCLRLNVRMFPASSVERSVRTFTGASNVPKNKSRKTTFIIATLTGRQKPNFFTFYLHKRQLFTLHFCSI